MICAAIMASRTRTPPSILSEMFGPQKLIVPRAPALGLLLEHPVFEKYNSKMEAVNAGVKPDAPDRENLLRPPIDFEHFRDEMEEFKVKYIYHNMQTQESKLGVWVVLPIGSGTQTLNSISRFDGWVRSIDAYGGPDLRYFNSQGVVPDICIVKQGKERKQAFKEKKNFGTTNFNTDSGKNIDIVESEIEVEKTMLAEMEG
jgi:tRNA pseudouridine38-40 synthase